MFGAGQHLVGLRRLRADDEAGAGAGGGLPPGQTHGVPPGHQRRRAPHLHRALGRVF